MKRDWRKYNAELIKRGQILIDKSLVDDCQQHQDKPKRGRPFKYPATLIVSALILRFIFRLPYRQLEGFLKSLLPDSQIPRFTTIHHRAFSLSQKIESLLKDTFVDFKSLPNEFVIVIDTTGMKVYNSGEWRSVRFKDSRRKWLKFHVAVEHKTSQVMAFSLTEPSVHDSREGMKLIHEVVQASEREGKRVKKVLADKGYDTHKVFNFLSDMGIEAGIIPRKGSKVRGDSARDNAVRAIRREGKKRYKQRIGYSDRNVVESFFASFKGMFGESLMSRKWESARLEVFLKVWIHNRFSVMNSI